MLQSIILPLAMGFVLFLFGMKVMEIALQKAAGNGLPLILGRFTRTPARGMAASAVMTAALQSSTAVTVITIGLANAGLLRFSQTLGVILGANIGTCLTTELLGLELNRAALPLLLTSAAAWLIGRLLPDRIRGARRFSYAALAVAGFACILLGMDIMHSLIPELRERGVFAWLVRQSQESRLWGILAGAAVTALVHSSAAVIGMAMGLTTAGVFPPELSIAVILGANVGTCVTALLASIGGSRIGFQVAMTHILLNVGGAAVFYPLIPALASISAILSDDPAAQIARAQTIFNIACSLVALPVCYLPSLRKTKAG
ncbi:Na/Pi cotransporter family protein [Gorillibacterium massiliense]|uniref:Na/Pi cotransporter family protein n=1 Tax=Gorillibacterium massiliense TaxID=1280390 RepID=UPI0004B22F21|nr:Na/Pi symporter [Gorillibacterium massiliense]